MGLHVNHAPPTKTCYLMLGSPNITPTTMKSALHPLRHLLVLLALMLLGTGCQGQDTTPSTPTTETREAVCLFIGLDGTGSYEHLDRAKNVTLKIISHLPGGSKIYVRWITANSNSDRGTAIVSGPLPKMPDKPSNPFATQTRQRYKRALIKTKRAQKQIEAALTRAKSPQANYTDIVGALYAASQRCSDADGLRPVIVLMTDMVDNAERSYPDFPLSGARVHVLAYQTDGGKPNRKQQWTRRLKEHGADSVAFAHLDAVLDTKEILN